MSDSDGPSEPASILIIEDDDVTATEMQNGLIGAGYVVWRARSGDEALVTLNSIQTDLIYVSLMLPDTDGLILCSTLKAHMPAPIIIVSTRSSEIDRALAMESGAIDCLTKPVDREELLAQVEAALHCQRASSSACSPHHA
jgi:DNA-binding response OmpR family regulator